MNDLDRNLLDAWHRVMERCQSDSMEALRRWQRSRQNTILRPPRAWCLAIRAADTRIGEGVGAWVEPGGVEYPDEHEVVLTGESVRALCAPVALDWPGISLREATAKLGRTRDAIRDWMPVRPGKTRAERSARQPRRWELVSSSKAPLSVRYEHPHCHGHAGVDVAVVWTRRPIDPNATQGEPPHPVWGSMWESMFERVPDHFEVTLRRVPRFRRRAGRRLFHGWDWLCPGRIDTLTKVPVGCGRRCRRLFLSLPVCTIGRWFGSGEGVEVGEQESADGGEALSRKRLGLVGRWFPGLDDPLAGQRSFACRRCWRVNKLYLYDYKGWNEFVTYISGGLLFGHEVDRPTWVKYERKRPKCARPRRRIVEVVNEEALTRKRQAGG